MAAIEKIASFVKPGGALLLIARGREPEEPTGELPWPVTREELAGFVRARLKEQHFEDYLDEENPPVRRYRVLYTRPE